MKSAGLIAVLFLLTVGAPTCSRFTRAPATMSPATTEPPPRPDVFQMALALGRGLNLGNALEAPREGAWGVTLHEEYFAAIAAAGFNSVRLPVRFSAHASVQAPYTIAPACLQRVDWAVDQALDKGLVVVLDMHHYEELMADPEAHRERFVALWAQLAEHYAGYPDGLYLELLNEPCDSLSAQRWNRLLKEAIAAIRRTNPTRVIVVGPAEWNSPYRLHQLDLPADDRWLIVTFHYYQPFVFTHQGAEWVEGANAWLGTRWLGSDAERRAITSDLDAAASWAQRNDRPLFLGEFGAYERAPIADRARWTAFVAREAEKRGMAWCYWEFCAGFGAYDPERRQWRADLLAALIPSP